METGSNTITVHGQAVQAVLQACKQESLAKDLLHCNDCTLNAHNKIGEVETLGTSQCRMGISCDFLTIYDDLYKTYLWGICITLNLFVALTAASESIYDVINMAAT